MFVFKKVMGAFVMPLGFVVMLLLVSGLWWLRGRHKTAGWFNLMLGLGIWIASSAMVTHWLGQGLTRDLKMPESFQGDVIILLGGGIVDRAVDLSGLGVPTATMAERIMTAARLYRRLDVPIIVSGGMVFNVTRSEAEIARRLLMDLGVSPTRILTEDKSRDTMENARYTMALCTAQGFRRPLLVTSLEHLKRSVWCFRRVGLEVTPVPVGQAPDRFGEWAWQDLLPGSFVNLTRAVHEYIGLAYYRLVY
jgi:uncharacterized SAM-binding protein YcdF (DUF218 family)